MFLLNLGTYLHAYTALQPRKKQHRHFTFFCYKTVKILNFLPINVTLDNIQPEDNSNFGTCAEFQNAKVVLRALFCLKGGEVTSGLQPARGWTH
jgi:hypothetical protein